MNGSKYLAQDADTRIFKETVACAIGLNESIALNQINYWISVNEKSNRHFHDGRYWMYATYEELVNKYGMKFWSITGTKNIIKRLRTLGVLIVGNYNTMKMDRTNWYAIDYEKLDEICNNYEFEERKKLLESEVNDIDYGESTPLTDNTIDYHREKQKPMYTTSFSSENSGDEEIDILIRKTIADLRAHKQSDESITNEIKEAYAEYCKKFHREYKFYELNLITKNCLYFVHAYKLYTGQYHNIYKTYAFENMRRMIDVFVTNLIDEDIIDAYFNANNFSDGCNYRLAHFLSQTIIDILVVQTYGTK